MKREGESKITVNPFHLNHHVSIVSRLQKASGFVHVSPHLLETRSGKGLGCQVLVHSCANVAPRKIIILPSKSQ